mgnify:FL=1
MYYVHDTTCLELISRRALAHSLSVSFLDNFDIYAFMQTFDSIDIFSAVILNGCVRLCMRRGQPPEALGSGVMSFY